MTFRDLRPLDVKLRDVAHSMRQNMQSHGADIIEEARAALVNAEGMQAQIDGLRNAALEHSERAARNERERDVWKADAERMASDCAYWRERTETAVRKLAAIGELLKTENHLSPSERARQEKNFAEMQCSRLPCVFRIF
jgi:hypothetical protein